MVLRLGFSNNYLDRDNIPLTPNHEFVYELRKYWAAPSYTVPICFKLHSVILLEPCRVFEIAAGYFRQPFVVWHLKHLHGDPQSIKWSGTVWCSKFQTNRFQSKPLFMNVIIYSRVGMINRSLATSVPTNVIPSPTNWSRAVDTAHRWNLSTFKKK